jgi:hypothetical protein
MKIKLKDVRLTFPSLWELNFFNKSETDIKKGNYEATFLIDKSAQRDIIETVQNGINKLINDELSGTKISSDRRCLRDGDEKDYDGYSGCMSLKSSTKHKPIIIDERKNPLTENNGKIYSGCYVNAIIELWAQNKAQGDGGKRINARLLGVQFSRNGMPLLSSSTASADDFDDVSDEVDVTF